MIIIPSRPRLSTPERSTTSSPAAAKRSGVDAAITDRMMASSRSMRRLPERTDEADSVDDQGIAGQHVEQQDSLEHLGEVQRDLHRNLRILAADERKGEEQPGDQYAHRIESPQERDDDGSEAIARRDAWLQMSDRSRHLDDAGKPGERSGNREG